MSTTPRIYVACLSAYNHGELHGVWIDVTLGKEHIQDEIKAMLAQSPRAATNEEEWAIHDTEGFGELNICEGADLSQLVEKALFIEEHGEDLGSAVLSYFCNTDEARELIENRYYGEYDSEAAFAESIADDVYEIPSYLASYIDYKAMAYDLFISDYFSINVGRKVHVFSEC